MRLFVPAALAAFTAAAIPAAPALASSCGCGHRVGHPRAYHRLSYARPVLVRPVVRRVVYRPRIVEVVRPVYRPVVYRPVRRVFVESIYRPRPVFYGARFHHRPHYGFYRHDGFRSGFGGERYGYVGGYRHDGFRHGTYRPDGFRGDGDRRGGDFHRGGYGWR